MHATTAHRDGRRYAGDAPPTSGPYWGWSHRNQRMEFMDLPSYMDSFRQGYDSAFGGLMTGMQQAGWPVGAVPGPAAMPASLAPPGPGPGSHRRHHHRHGHHEHEDRGCGCEHGRDRDCDGCEHGHGRGCGRCEERDCRCDCCIVDADIVVYGHCGEVRVVPIEVINDSRKVRENVDVQVSDIRSAGGRVLNRPTLIQPKGPVNLEPCRATRLELLVHLACGTESDASAADDAPGQTDAPPDAFAALAAQRDRCPDVDRCEVGYTSIRLDGCLIRPIVVAIAVLPAGCDTYRIGCSCGCCR